MDIITVDFKVAVMSVNTNSFGLFRIIVISKDGHALEVLKSQYNKPQVGDILRVKAKVDSDGNIQSYDLSSLGGECPARLANAPREVVKEVWS
jgi:hypothetical protein